MDTRKHAVLVLGTMAETLERSARGRDILACEPGLAEPVTKLAHYIACKCVYLDIRMAASAALTPRQKGETWARLKVEIAAAARIFRNGDNLAKFEESMGIIQRRLQVNPPAAGSYSDWDGKFLDDLPVPRHKVFALVARCVVGLLQTNILHIQLRENLFALPEQRNLYFKIVFLKILDHFRHHAADDAFEETLRERSRLNDLFKDLRSASSSADISKMERRYSRVDKDRYVRRKYPVKLELLVELFTAIMKRTESWKNELTKDLNLKYTPIVTETEKAVDSQVKTPVAAQQGPVRSQLSLAPQTSVTPRGPDSPRAETTDAGRTTGEVAERIEAAVTTYVVQAASVIPETSTPTPSPQTGFYTERTETAVTNHMVPASSVIPETSVPAPSPQTGFYTEKTTYAAADHVSAQNGMTQSKSATPLAAPLETSHDPVTPTVVRQTISKPIEPPASHKAGYSPVSSTPAQEIRGSPALPAPSQETTYSPVTPPHSLETEYNLVIPTPSREKIYTPVTPTPAHSPHTEDARRGHTLSQEHPGGANSARPPSVQPARLQESASLISLTPTCVIDQPVLPEVTDAVNNMSLPRTKSGADISPTDAVSSGELLTHHATTAPQNVTHFADVKKCERDALITPKLEVVRGCPLTTAAESDCTLHHSAPSNSTGVNSGMHPETSSSGNHRLVGPETSPSGAHPPMHPEIPLTWRHLFMDFMHSLGQGSLPQTINQHQRIAMETRLHQQPAALETRSLPAVVAMETRLLSETVAMETQFLAEADALPSDTECSRPSSGGSVGSMASWTGYVEYSPCRPEQEQLVPSEVDYSGFYEPQRKRPRVEDDCVKSEVKTSDQEAVNDHANQISDTMVDWFSVDVDDDDEDEPMQENSHFVS